MSSDISGRTSEHPSTRSTASQISEEESVKLSLDLVSASRHNLKFLRYVANSDWLHHPTTLLEAIRRYEELWMPLISDLTVGSNAGPPMILPPFDVEWVWYCHTLNPVHYKSYCETRFSKVIGKPAIFDEENEEYAVTWCREIWRNRYPEEPFDNEVDTCREGKKMTANEVVLMEEMAKQKGLYEKFFWEPYMDEMVYLIAAKRRYKKLLLLLMQQMEDDGDSGGGGGCNIFVPTVDILLMWLTHKSYPTVYAADTKHMEDELPVRLAGPWDSVEEEDIKKFKRLWETTFDQPYEKAGGRVAADLQGGCNLHRPVYWLVSDTDVNTKYPSLHPRFLLEVCVFVRLRSLTDAVLTEKTREFLRLQVQRCHKELKLEKPISELLSESWLKAWHLYCEFGTKGIDLVIRYPSSLCFSGASVLDKVSFSWNELLRAPSLAFGRNVDEKIRVFTSITPPVQAPYLLKCVPDRVTDDSGAMISDVMLRLNQYRPQEGRWLTRTVLDHSGRECFVVRLRVCRGFWRRGGETPETVKWQDRIIEIREGPWSYVAGSTIGKAPDKVVGTAKPREESKEGRASWFLSTGDELTVQWESSASLATLSFILTNQTSEYSVKLLKGRKMQYEVSTEEQERQHKTQQEAEEGFVTLVKFSDENPCGKATALLNWKMLAVEVMPEEDAVFVLLLCTSILRSVSEMRKEDIGGLLIRRRLKEAKHGMRDWGSVISYSSALVPASSPHIQPWYWDAKAVLAHDYVAEERLSRLSLPVPSHSLAEGGDKLYKKGIYSGEMK